MSRLSGASLLALAMAALLGSLTLVTWRQTRALEALAELDAVQSEVSLAQAEREELTRRIRKLESRAHVTAAAAGIGMHTPEASEIVYLTGAPR